MLTIHTPSVEYFNDATQEFVSTESTKLQLEHSLVSLSKWESIWEKPFLGPETKTDEEAKSYVECMLMSDEVPEGVFEELSDDNLQEVNAYINSRMTATTFNDDKVAGTSRLVITSELIYYWMFSLTIPIDCENWHLERLFALIKVFNAKNAPAKKTSRGDLAAKRRELNAQRKAQMGTTG